MGGELSVCNRTSSSIHVGFGHVGPLYYENYLTPDQCTVYNDIGNSWMTVWVRESNGSNGITTTDCVAPALAVGGAVLACTGVGCAFIGANVVGFAETLGAFHLVSSSVQSAMINAGSCLVTVTHVLKWGGVIAAGVTGVSMAQIAGDMRS